MRHVALVLLVVNLAAVVVSCGGDGDRGGEGGKGNGGGGGEERTMNETPKVDCGNLGELQLEVVSGDVPCDEVREVAGGYDLQGAKVQEIGDWACESGEADTRPIIFTCTRGDMEFVAKEADG